MKERVTKKKFVLYFGIFLNRHHTGQFLWFEGWDDFKILNKFKCLKKTKTKTS